MDKTIRQVRAGQEPPDLPIDMAQPDDGYIVVNLGDYTLGSLA
jgi:hypothetical protein